MKNFEFFKIHGKRLLFIIFFIFLLSPKANVFAFENTYINKITKSLTSITDGFADKWRLFIQGNLPNDEEKTVNKKQIDENSFIPISIKQNNIKEIINDNKIKNKIPSPFNSITTLKVDKGVNGIQGPIGPRGLQGPIGPKGESGNSLDASFFVSKVFFTRQVDKIFESIHRNIKNLSDLLAEEVKTKSLIVSGNANINGDLTITGNLVGNVAGTINPSFTSGSIPFQGTSGLTENSSNLFWDETNLRLGLGTMTPTARLHLSAGTATAGTAPLKVTAGTNLGTTEAGAIEYDGSHLYFTATNAGTRYQLDQQGILSDADLNTKGGTSAGLNLVVGGGGNTFFGYEAGKGGVVTSLVYNNTGIGYQSLFSNTTGYENTGVGSDSLRNNTTGYYNTAIGPGALSFNTTGHDNNAIGNYSLYSNTTGSHNTANGGQSLLSNTTGHDNIAIGNYSLYYNTTGYNNTAIGPYSLFSNTTGFDNTANGTFSLYYNTTGLYNTASGFNSLNKNTTGTYNTANGMQSLYSNTIGSYNTANGLQALYYNTTGHNNTIEGYNSLFSNTTGSFNVAIGNEAARYQANGSTALTDPENSVYIGANTKGKDNSDSNSIVVGYNAIGKGANTAVWGNTNIINHYLNGSVQFSTYGAGTLTTDATGNITASSDEKLKNIIGDFNNNNDALKTISYINPILYKWNTLSGYDQNTTYAGFSAQNIKELIPEAIGLDKNNYLTLSDRPILATAINAIKELDLKIKDLSLGDANKTISFSLMFKSFLEDAGNGFEIVFFREVHTKKLCLEDICIDKAQLEQLLNNLPTSQSSINNSEVDTQDQTNEQPPVIDNPASGEVDLNSNPAYQVVTPDSLGDSSTNEMSEI